MTESSSNAESSPLEDSTLEGGLLREFLAQSRRATRNVFDVGSWPAGKEILEHERDVRAKVVVLVARVLARGNQRRTKATYEVKRIGKLTMTTWDPQGIRKTVGWTYRQGRVMKVLMSRLMRSRLPFDERQLVVLVESQLTDQARDWDMPVTSVVTAVERHVREHGLSAELRRAVEALRLASRASDPVKVPRAVRLRLDALTEPEG